MKKIYHYHGFTLIELIIAVAIIGILLTVAVPSYTQYVQRSSRADARNVLTSVAQRLEQNYSIAGSYNKTQDGADINDAMLTTWGLHQSPSSGSAKYTISFKASSLTATAFVVQATPTGSQGSDFCGTLALNERNLKAAKGSNPGDSGVSRSQNTVDCWGK